MNNRAVRQGGWLLACLAMTLGAYGPVRADPKPDGFSLEAVVEQARELAARPHDDSPPVLPPVLEQLTYDQYRRIQHDRDKAVWSDQDVPFRLMFFHRGWLQRSQVDIAVVRDGRAEPVEYHSEWFEYHEPIGPLPADLGFAGFKILHQLNQPGKWDEVASFLGASYFRVLGAGMHYGLSIRGLAVDTGLPSGEEFPAFTKFWIVQPESDARTITLYALLDSRSITGAYRFDITPGEQTQVDVQCELFPRTSIQKLGIAPLTSMYLYGESDVRPVFDFRPEVHDSDGLLVADAGGEWIWRPLINPRQSRLSSFSVRTLRGFGLMQRDRDFIHYQDLEAMYHARPSVWVEPIDGFGAGRVELFELASDDEGMDNIVAAFIENAPVEAGSRLAYRYRLHVSAHGPEAHTGGKAVSTRMMWRPENFPHKTITVPEGAMRFLIDFAGGPLERYDLDDQFDALRDGPAVELVATATNGTIRNEVAQYNPVTKSWRAFFDVVPEDRGKVVELRAFLRHDGDVLTETWSYPWKP